MKKRWKNPEFRVNSSISRSKSSKKRWQDPEYRAKMLVVIQQAHATSKKPKKVTIKCSICGVERIVNRRYANSANASRPCRTCSMKKKWQDKEYKQHISSLVGENTKKQWEKLEFRKAVTETNSITWKKRTEELSRRALALWQNDEYRTKVIDGMATPAAREKLATAIANQSGRISSIQTMLYTYLDELGVEYYKEGKQTRIGFYVFDCLIVNSDKKILVECQGDYWHSSSAVKNKDKSKFTYISRYFPEYEIMYIWEHEFYCKDRVLDRLKLKLGVDVQTEKFKFSDLMLREIDSTEVKQFLDLYHYLGKDRGGKAIGAFFGDLLIAAVVFSPPLRQNTAGQFGLIDGEVRELSRMCIHPSYHKKNFASWFLKRTLKQIDCKLVVAYADTTVGHTGIIYKASNFKLHHIVPADYWYMDKEGYVLHKRTLYGHARSLRMTETEFAETKGYIKKYGGQKLCYSYQR